MDELRQVIQNNVYIESGKFNSNLSFIFKDPEVVKMLLELEPNLSRVLSNSKLICDYIVHGVPELTPIEQ